ncbi:hypothetical protein DSO57_1000103 [Entomophthora muscae]|uniref:Uncharacterized protein n=1 Tax=Entomophthora muscae TaxID=34485 RepID=A0ACC2SMH8_9FUNG|nr:hypothetical protein DSO57_1000103 [Entomophthora muscae]
MSFESSHSKAYSECVPLPFNPSVESAGKRQFSTIEKDITFVVHGAEGAERLKDHRAGLEDHGGGLVEELENHREGIAEGIEDDWEELVKV